MNSAGARSIGRGGDPLCKICGDRSSGKHFGITVCDGCKGFFRRSVRNDQVYICRFDKNCVINKDHRNKCRYCRLRKCYRAGMRKEAVQNERDQIKTSKTNGNGGPVDNPLMDSAALTLDTLIHADESTKHLTNCSTEVKGKATVNDFYDSLKEQLIRLIEWAKLIPAFNHLAIADKVALIRGHSGDFLLVGFVRRSMPLKDTLLFANGFILTRESDDADVLGVNRRIIDELVNPWRRTNIDDTEFACLKAIVFFDPTAEGLSEEGVSEVFDLRQQAQILLEDYIADRKQEARGRFGEILLTLPSLSALSLRMREEMQFRKLFGTARIDKLLQETYLGEVDESSGDEQQDFDIPIQSQDQSEAEILKLEEEPMSSEGMKQQQCYTNPNSVFSMSDEEIQSPGESVVPV